MGMIGGRHFRLILGRGVAMTVSKWVFAPFSEEWLSKK